MNRFNPENFRRSIPAPELDLDDLSVEAPVETEEAREIREVLTECSNTKLRQLLLYDKALISPQRMFVSTDEDMLLQQATSDSEDPMGPIRSVASGKHLGYSVDGSWVDLMFGHHSQDFRVDSTEPIWTLSVKSETDLVNPRNGRRYVERKVNKVFAEPVATDSGDVSIFTVDTENRETLLLEGSRPGTLAEAQEISHLLDGCLDQAIKGEHDPYPFSERR